MLIALGVIPGASFELESTKVGFATRLATLSALEALHAVSFPIDLRTYLTLSLYRSIDLSLFLEYF